MRDAIHVRVACHTRSIVIAELASWSCSQTGSDGGSWAPTSPNCPTTERALESLCTAHSGSRVKKRTVICDCLDTLASDSQFALTSSFTRACVNSLSIKNVRCSCSLPLLQAEGCFGLHIDLATTNGSELGKSSRWVSTCNVVDLLH